VCYRKNENAPVLCTVSDSEVMEQRMGLKESTPRRVRRGNASSDSNVKITITYDSVEEP
jgi:hypothetical protein